MKKRAIKQESSFKKYFDPLISQQHLKSQRITELHKKQKKEIKNININIKNVDKKHKSKHKSKQKILITFKSRS